MSVRNAIRLFSSFLIATMGLSSFAAAAQDWIGSSPMELGWQHSNALGLIVQHQILDNLYDDDEEQNADEPEADMSAEAEVKRESVNLEFKHSAALQKQNIAGFIAATKRHDPKGAQQLEQLTQSVDVFDAISTAIEAYGLRGDNIADAYALWWVSAWMAYAKDYSQTDRAALLAVKEQVTQTMQSMPEMRVADDAEKQQFTEALLLQMALIDTAAETAKTNPDYGAQLAAATKQAGNAMGLDFDKMRLTATGFQPK